MAAKTASTRHLGDRITKMGYSQIKKMQLALLIHQQRKSPDYCGTLIRVIRFQRTRFEIECGVKSV